MSTETVAPAVEYHVPAPTGVMATEGGMIVMDHSSFTEYRARIMGLSPVKPRRNYRKITKDSLLHQLAHEGCSAIPSHYGNIQRQLLKREAAQRFPESPWGLRVARNPNLVSLPACCAEDGSILV